MIVELKDLKEIKIKDLQEKISSNKLKYPKKKYTANEYIQQRTQQWAQKIKTNYEQGKIKTLYDLLNEYFIRTGKKKRHHWKQIR
jgi:hypothetical protein